MRLNRRLTGPLAGLLFALLLALGLLSGCGSSDNGVSQKLANEILAASKVAAQEASSVHVVSQSSQGPLKSSVDLWLSKGGGRGKVSFLGTDFEVISIGQTVYVKGNKAFLAGLSGVLGKSTHIPAGAWLKGSASRGPLAQLAAFTQMGGELERLLSTPGTVSKGAKATVKGQQVIALKEKTKVYEGALYVATSGKPYPVELIKSGGRERGRTSYSGWDQGVSPQAPSGTVDIASLTTAAHTRLK